VRIDLVLALAFLHAMAASTTLGLQREIAI
jgi:hypothetical protein